MGIKYLNKFLRKECNEQAIRQISLSELSGKKIAVDISIYMYKYAGEETLIESMYLMLSIFRKYNIIPIFIFDGKPPLEKKELLQIRYTNKKDAEEEYNKLNQSLEKDDIDDIEKQDIINHMDALKKKFVYINKTQIESVKRLIRAYGSSYVDAPGEADQLCVSLVINNKVWCCLSEDMDMFLYGCSRVIRYMSLLNHTAVLYDIKNILNNLGITQKELREICVLSGTDYNTHTKANDNINTSSPTLYVTLKYFKKYRKSKSNQHFYDWLKERSNYIDDYELLQKIYNMFDLTNYDLQIFENIKIINCQINRNDLREILIQDGFIFPEKL
jgi:flap endonuclease-1